MVTFPFVLVMLVTLVHSFEITVINKTKGGKKGSIHETTLEFIHFERTRSVSFVAKKKKKRFEKSVHVFN